MSWVLRELPTNPEIKLRWRFHGETVAIRKRFWLGYRPLFNRIAMVNNSESAL